MAIPVTFNANEGIYHVHISMGSQFQGKGKDIDDFTREIKYKYGKETRQQIGAIRQSVNTRRAAGCTKCFGAYFTNRTGLEQLRDVCAQADREMKAIDPSLHVTMEYIRQHFEDSENITVLDKLLKGIRADIHERVLFRIQEVIARADNKKLTEKTKKALFSMLDKTKALNLTNDPAVNEDIEKMRARIQADQLAELRDEILVILDDTKDRAQALELTEPIKIDESGNTPAPAPVIPQSGRSLDLF